MSDILLVHGSCHGAWCWRDLVPALTALGHTVRAIDLPSHGQDATAIQDVTLDRCGQAVVDALGDSTIVVGHSWGGYPIARAADLAPKKIKRLVFLCAYAPWDGHSLADMRRAAPRQPSLDAVIKSDYGLSYTIDPAKTRRVFYHDCLAGTEDFANGHLCPQPILPQETPITLGAGYDTTPKSYIRCNNDQTIPPEFQRTMTENWPQSDVYELDTGHSPFLAAPEALAALLQQIIDAKA
jgi:pimeloyl-ACP methyl ester carboxylesterase